MAGRFRTEDEFVAWLRRRSGPPSPKLRLGIGDDAALIRSSAGTDLAVTADLTIEGVHFSKILHPPDAVGHRALARSLSDIAAMGGVPKFALIAMALPRRPDGRWIEQFYAGMLRLARRFGVRVIGGDTSIRPGKTLADVVVIGEVKKGRALLRSGARPGDAIFVAGALGLSALGLRLLRSNPNARKAGALRAHLYPEPQCRLGAFLASGRLASAAMDLSDGLSLDLLRLAKASRVGARLREDAIPTARPGTPGVSGAAAALSLALNGGEDYKLLFTVPATKAARVPTSFEGVRLHRIGEICSAGQGIALIDGNGKSKPLATGGYDHFRRN